METIHFDNLTDEALLAEVERLSREENDTTCLLLLFLAELDVRESFRELGYSSLFDLCVRKLFYSEPAANRRIKAARCVRRFPRILELLRSRELSLTTVTLISKLLNEDNLTEVVRAVSGKGKHEVEQYVDRVLQRNVVVNPKEGITPIFKVVPNNPTSQGSLFSQKNPLKYEQPGGPRQGETPLESLPPHQVQTDPLYQFQFSLNANQKAEFERVQILLSRKLGRIPTLQEVFAETLRFYRVQNDPVERENRRVKRTQLTSAKQWKTPEKIVAQSPATAQRNSGKPHGVCEQISPSERPRRSRKIPRRVVDAVFNRDEMQCTFIAPDGTRCGCKTGLQIDHVRPFALGGAHTIENLRVLCSTHNRLEAEKVFGRQVLERYRKFKRDPRRIHV